MSSSEELPDRSASHNQGAPSSSHPADHRPDPRWGSADVEGIIEAIERAEPRADDLRDCPHVDEDVNPADHYLPAPPLSGRDDVDDNALPGFGEPLPDCGEFVPEAIYFCPDCLEKHEKRHICNRHDCPQHAPYAIRRLLLGNGDELGVAAKFGGLMGALFASREHSQVPRTLFISPPQGEKWVTESSNPLDRTFDLVGEIMSLLGGDGLQGRVSYHPVRGRQEGPGEDDRGQWRDRLFSERDWADDVARELRYSPHFHVRAVGYADVKSQRVVDEESLEIIRVAEPGVDVDREGRPLPGALADHETVMSVTGLIEARTGWSIHLQEDAQGRSMSHENEHRQRIKIAAALAYDMSHSLIYTDSAGDRRIASRWKGDMINNITYNKYEEEIQKAVFEASVDTLGIKPPVMECDREVSRTRVPLSGESDSSSSSSSSSGSCSASRSTDLPTASNADVSGEVIVGSSGPVHASSSVPDTPGTSTKTERCGGELKHISTFDLEELQDLDQRDDVDASDLEAAYRSYVQYMTAKHLATSAGLYGDRPPPD